MTRKGSEKGDVGCEGTKKGKGKKMGRSCLEVDEFGEGEEEEDDEVKRKENSLKIT